MNYPPSYHAACESLVKGHSRAFTRQRIAAALRDLRRIDRNQARRELRHFYFVNTRPFCRP
jgi:hypothetical protein